MNVHPVCATCGRKKSGARALFRYQGGKQRLCGRIAGLFPLGARRYFEPFIGAGSVYLEFRNSGFRGPAFLGDWNLDVVNVHRAVADDPTAFEQAYARHVELHGREHFYHLRGQDASQWAPVERAARTVYLAKAAYHGLLRVNGQGQTVSTYGTGELSRVLLDGDRIRKASEAFRKAEIWHADFGWVKSMAEEGDLVFLDPPYVNTNDRYTADGFGLDDQHRLAGLCRKLDERGVLFMQTNSDCGFIRDLYGQFHVAAVPPRPSLSCDGTSRQPMGEVIIANYEPEAKANGELEVAA